MSPDTDTDTTLYRSALETWAEPALLWDAGGRIAFASHRFLESFGLPREEIEGTPEDGFNRVLASRGAQPLPKGPIPAVIAINGRRFERHSRLLPNGGRLDVFRDVTDTQDSAARREELLGVASHDLRSPLANVRSYAGLLLGGRMAEPDPRVKRSAEVIARNADRALKLIQAYFDSLRAETGELEIDRQPVPLVQVIEEAIQSRRATAAEKSVELIAQLPANLTPIPGDRDRLMNSIGAFLDNAIARSAPESQVRVVLEEQSDQVWVGFLDGGAPLSAEESREAFDRDAQILRERRLGVGFSLAVARAIAVAHGGTAGVSARENQTAFFLTLPRNLI